MSFAEVQVASFIDADWIAFVRTLRTYKIHIVDSKSL